MLHMNRGREILPLPKRLPFVAHATPLSAAGLSCRYRKDSLMIIMVMGCERMRRRERETRQTLDIALQMKMNACEIDLQMIAG